MRFREKDKRGLRPSVAERPKGKTQIKTISYMAIRGATPRPYNPRRERDAPPIYLRLLPTGGFLSLRKKQRACFS